MRGMCGWNFVGSMFRTIRFKNNKFLFKMFVLILDCFSIFDYLNNLKN